jgi:DNA-binding NarL/FixJ family response regulator
MPINAIVADDHPLFRVALKQAVSEVLEDSIAESSTLAETISVIEAHPEVQLVFLDLNMPGNEGLMGLTLLRNSFPDVLVVIVSAEEAPEVIYKAMELGACGYIPKSTPLPQITAAVADIMEGQQWLPTGLSQPSNDFSQSDEETSFMMNLKSLTPHQFTVLKMMADGLLNKQIAYELGVKETTVKQHGSAILRKLGLNNRTQAGVLFKQVLGR